MDARLLAVIDRLSEDLANLEKALAQTQALLHELGKEVRKNGKTQEKHMEAILATQRFLAGQQPRRGGAFPLRAWRENDEEQ